MLKLDQVICLWNSILTFAANNWMLTSRGGNDQYIQILYTTSVGSLVVQLAV